MKKLLLPLVLAIFFGGAMRAQQPVLNYIFTEDSLSGFNEDAAKKAALQNNCFENEFKNFMYKRKRDFVRHKYNLGDSHTQTVWRTASTASVQPACSNVDFETGTFAGWTVSTGYNSNSTTMAGCCPSSTGYVSQVVSATGNDPIAGSLIPLASPFGGSYIAKLNDSNTGAVVERISQTFNVTYSNAIFKFAYAGVLEAAGHTCPDQPYINVSVIDSAGNVLPCPNIVIQAPSSSCSQPVSVTAGWTALSSGPYYHAWEVKTIDLSPYVGTNITIQITVGDCAQGGHFGYGYFDCQCLPLQVGVNTTLYDATPLAPINVSTCGALTATLTAPAGLGPYNWDGPAGSGISANTNSVITTTTPGQYTLTMTPPNNCLGPIVKLVNLALTPAPTASNVAAQPTCTNAVGSATISATSGVAPYTYSWTPLAPTTGSVVTGLTPGSSYTVEVIDNVGCTATTTLSINSFTDAPTYTITSNPGLVLTCASPTVTLNGTPTSTYTTISWTGPTGAIPGNTVSVTDPGTYTFVATNTISTCVATITLAITGNTATPTGSFTKVCNTSSVVLSGIPGTPSNAYIGWTDPSGTPLGNPAQATTAGIYTLTVTDPANGCKSTYTTNVSSVGAPNTGITAAPGSSITCATSTVQATATSTTTGTTFSWILPGTPTSTASANPLPITSPGTYTAVITNTLNGCFATTTISIGTNTTAPVIGITSPGTVIPCATNSLALNGTSNVTGTTYSWTSGPTTQTDNVSAAGVYTVTGTNPANGCTSTATIAVSHETVTASFTADPTTGLMPLDVHFTNTSSPNVVSNAWDFANGNTSTLTNPSTNYPVQGLYTVTLTVTNGVCVDTATLVINVQLVSFLTVPNVFTPNGDGHNDVFSLKATNMGEITMTVFDRWGLKMFDATETGNMKWDGKNKGGAEVPDGTYFYVIKAKGLDDQDYNLKGTISLYR